MIRSPQSFRAPKSSQSAKAPYKQPLQPRPIKELEIEEYTYEAQSVVNIALNELDLSGNIKAEIKTEVKGRLNYLNNMIKDMYRVIRSNKGKTGETLQIASSRTDEEELPPKDKTITIVPAPDDEEDKWEKLKEELEKIRKEQIDMAKELKEINKSAKNVEKTTSEIKDSMPTYAQVLTSTARNSTESKLQAHTVTQQHTVIVASKEGDDTGDNVLNRIRMTLNAKTEGICIQRASKVRNQKVVLSCATEREIKVVHEKLEKEGALVVEAAKNKDPLIKIPGLMAYNKEEDIILSLKNQNKRIWEDMEPTDFQVKELYRRKVRNPLQCSVILQVSPQVHARILAAEKVYVDMQSLTVYDHSPIRQCSTCLINSMF